MRLLLLLLITFFTSIASAQEYDGNIAIQVQNVPERNNKNYNPFGDQWNEEKDLYSGPNLSVKDRSFSAGVMYHRYYKENLAFRVRAGIVRTSIKSSWTYSDASFVYQYTASKTQHDFYIAPGATVIFSVPRFNYFAGVEVPVTVHGPASVRKYYAYSLMSSGEQKSSTEVTGKYNNGWTAGVGAFGGFAVKVYRNITFGPEAGFAFTYSNHGNRGEFTTTVANGASYSEKASFTRNYSSLGITGLNGSLNLHWWF